VNEYNIARQFAKRAKSPTFEPLTDSQFHALNAAGLIRSNVEVRAFDDMERGHLARVRYLAGEIERMEE
jgi:hypothetical protein